MSKDIRSAFGKEKRDGEEDQRHMNVLWSIMPENRQNSIKRHVQSKLLVKSRVGVEWDVRDLPCKKQKEWKKEKRQQPAGLSLKESFEEMDAKLSAMLKNF